MVDGAAANIVGALAASFSFTLFMPQARAVWKYRRGTLELSGASRGTPVLSLANEASWITFAILTHNFWIAAPGIVNTPLAVFMLVVIGRSRRRLAELSARQCSRCRFERGEHVIFTTTPTGYGTVAECSPATVKDGIPVPRDLVAPAHTVTFAAQ